ncbi:hypothetical protein BpHYR1_000253 [Brachionus plicatilis]|uniref:Uncharacterized protein n=1 Tax=Brachionus plicatilis TaxID=10195 RepID=A0A3M7R7H4_BRAPC|nr:hypothetical protein BpHYR1_000253 [Brachionus plicatilis]
MLVNVGQKWQMVTATTSRLACGGVLHERSPMNKKIEPINNKIVCGAYGTKSTCQIGTVY